MPSARDDRGASLLFVLVFVMLVSAVGLSMLRFTEASFGTSDVVRTSRTENYTADAALEVAIRRLAADPTKLLGTPGSPCDTEVTGVNDRAAQVTCSAIDNAGGLDLTTASQVLLALSDDAPFELAGNRDLLVTGNVHTNGAFRTGQTFSKMTVAGTLSSAASPAAGADECADQTKIAASIRDCASAPVVPTPPAAPVATALPLNPPPKCAQSGTTGNVYVATFEPGTYTIPPNNGAFIDTDATCKNKNVEVLHFPPRATPTGTPTVFHLNGVELSTQRVGVPGNKTYDIVAGTATSWLGSSDVPLRDWGCDRTKAGVRFLVTGAGGVRATQNQDSALSLCSGATATPVVWGGTIFATANKTNLFVQGRLYAPAAAVSLKLQGDAVMYVRGSVVADTIALDWSPSNPQAVAPFEGEVGCTTCRSDRRVILTAIVNGESWIRAVVKFNDNDPAAPKPYTIESWSVLPA